MSRIFRSGLFYSLLIVFFYASVGVALPAHAQSAPEKHSLQVLQVESSEVTLPPEFQMALYENLIEQLNKTGKFQRVMRDGDRDAANAPGELVLHSDVRGFKEGSARLRQVTTVAGATSIKLHIRVTARDGSTVLERDVEGKVHFFGENLRATYNLAKNVAKMLNKELPGG